MAWKKLLDNKELIAYENSKGNTKIRLEARYRRQRWRVYKTFNVEDGDERISHVNEYIAATTQEARELLRDLKKETDIKLKHVKSKPLNINLKRCYKEDYVEKWKFTIDDFNHDNFVYLRFEEEIKLDIVLHERYNDIEKQILEEIIYSLGLKDINNKIRYDFFYFKRHSAKRRVYKEDLDNELLAQLEFRSDQ